MIQDHNQLKLRLIKDLHKSRILSKIPKAWKGVQFLFGYAEMAKGILQKKIINLNFKLLNSLKEQGRSDYSRLMKRKILNTSFGYSDKE